MTPRPRNDERRPIDRGPATVVAQPPHRVLTASPSRSALRLFVLAVGTAVLMVSCSGSGRTTKAPGLPNGFPNHSTDDIRSRIKGEGDTLRAYTAKARVTVQSPKQNRTFNAVVRHRRADSLFMRVSMFGIEGGRLLLTPDSVFFYDSRKAVLRVGPAEAVQNLFPAPVSSADFFENMLGLLAPTPHTDWSLKADSTLYYVSGPGDRRRYTVDPTRWRVVRYEKRARNGTVLQKRLFSNFRTIEGVLLPTRLIFHRPAADLRAVVHYQSMTLNPPDQSFALNVPPQIPRRPFVRGR